MSIRQDMAGVLYAGNIMVNVSDKEVKIDRRGSPQMDVRRKNCNECNVLLTN